MRRIAVVPLVALLACSPGTPRPSADSAPPRPLTRAERSNYLETSSYADVMGFLDSLRAINAPLVIGSIGKTTEGREIPYVIASRPLVRTAAEAHATGKLIVYVQGNIHAGEVEGKEALQALIRDLAASTRPNVLDSIVLVAVPIYNADGNERLLPQERARGSQNGPALVGQRPNAQDLDLNRDYIKAEAPETRASLAMFRAWNPDVFVDLHTTNGSYHGYALTYSPSLHPSAPMGEFSRALLAELRQRVRDRNGYETFDYGNFTDGGGREAITDSLHRGWATYDHRPRFGSNYYGLRGGISILSEAYSHDPFERRVKSTYAFTRQLLSLVAERGAEIRSHVRFAEAELAMEQRPPVVLKSALPATAPAVPVTYELLASTGDSTRTQPGVPPGLRRTGEYRTRPMPVFDRFVPVLTRTIPHAYVFENDTALVARLEAHGIRVERASAADRANLRLEAFAIDSVIRAPRPFQGHNEVRLVGKWVSLSRTAGDGASVVRTSQPLGRLAAVMLDAESDDGLATWNFFDKALAPGGAFPVQRATAAAPR